MVTKFESLVLKQLNTYNFITFKIYNNSKRMDVFGFHRNDCRGNTVLDGLTFIKENLDINLRIPKKKNCGKMYGVSTDETENECYCLNCIMKINGKTQSACSTKMRLTNTIEPIDLYPKFRQYGDIDLDYPKVRFGLTNIKTDKYYEKIYA